MAAAPCPPWVLLGHPHNHRAGRARLPWPRCEVGSQELSSSKVSRGQSRGGRGTLRPCCERGARAGPDTGAAVPSCGGRGLPAPRVPGSPLAGMEEILAGGPRQNNAPCVPPQRAPATLPTGGNGDGVTAWWGTHTHHPPASGTSPPQNHCASLLAWPQGTAKGRRGLDPKLGAVRRSQRGVPWGPRLPAAVTAEKSCDNHPMEMAGGALAQGQLPRPGWRGVCLGVWHPRDWGDPRTPSAISVPRCSGGQAGTPALQSPECHCSGQLGCGRGCSALASGRAALPCLWPRAGCHPGSTPLSPLEEAGDGIAETGGSTPRAPPGRMQGCGPWEPVAPPQRAWQGPRPTRSGSRYPGIPGPHPVGLPRPPPGMPRPSRHRHPGIPRPLPRGRSRGGFP